MTNTSHAMSVDDLRKSHGLRMQCCKNCANHFRYGRGPYRCGKIDTRQWVNQSWVCDLWEMEKPK
jgi:hypothetical protein